MRRIPFLACVAIMATASSTGIAAAGPVRDLYSNGRARPKTRRPMSRRW